MTASIVLTGLAASDPVPGIYIEINFAQGSGGGSGSTRPVLFLGNKLAAGNATVDTMVYGSDTPIACQTESDVIALFGAGSELHRMARRFWAVNKVSSLYFLAVTESAGAAATGAITIATTATGNGNVRLWVEDEAIDVPVFTNDTPTTVAAAAVQQIAMQSHWPVTATNAAGVITITAKQKGPRGNFIRYQASVSGGIGTTVTATAATLMTGGTTADSNVAALATILPKRYYYITSAAEDATQLGALVSQNATQSLPLTGIRQRVIAGNADTLANAITLATGRNAVLAGVAWQPGSDWTPAELAANQAAVYSLYEAERDPRPRHNFSGFGNDANTQASWKVPAPRSGVAPTRADIKSALMNGLTPIASNTNGSTYLVKAITTRSLTGATADYRARDWHKVTVMHFFADALQAKTALQCGGMDIGNDPPKGGQEPGPSVITPLRYRSLVFSVINEFADNDQFQNVDAIKAGTVVQRETNPPTRMSVRVPGQPIDVADQFSLALDQIA